MQRRYKRPFDLSVLIASHLFFFPVWLLLWLVIPASILLFDRGPIFFRQERTGRFGKSFTLLKFRTMSEPRTPGTLTWTVEGDSRITPVGKILRRTALDELPGLLSIWKGDMSLVGPRALDVREQQFFEELIPDFSLRLQVLPGLTGLAQVKDKMDIAGDKLRYDLEYIDSMGFWLDIRLLIRSVLNTFAGQWDKRKGKSSTVDPQV